MKWRQFTIRTMLLAITCAGIFCAGYLAGFDNGRNARFDDLIKLIHDTIVPSSNWETNGVIAPTGGGCTIVVSDDSSAADPFASTLPETDSNDPFASPRTKRQIPLGQRRCETDVWQH